MFFMDGFKQFTKFIKSIKKTDKTVMAYDKDGDGVTAVTQALVALKRMKIESEAHPFERADITAFTNELKNLKPTHVVIFDISAENYSEIFESLPKVKFMIIDHHKRYGQPKNALIIKPDNLDSKRDPAGYPTAKMAYDLFMKIVDISDLDWVASIGIISDAGYPSWKSFVDKAMKKKKWSPGKDIFESVPGQIAAMINAANAVHESRITEALDVMLTLSPRKIMKSDLFKLSETVWSEVRKLAEKKVVSQLGGKLKMLEIKSEYKIAGFVSNLVSRKYLDSVCIITEPSKDWVKISARCQTGGIAVNNLLETATKGFEESKAGGHKPAAGAIIKARDYSKFKKNLISEMKRLLK